MDGLLQPTCARSKAWIDHWCSGFLSIWLPVCMVCVLYALGKLFCSPNSNTHHHIKKGHATFAPIFCFGFTNGMYPTVRRLIVRILRYRWGYRAFDCLCFLFSCHSVQWWMQPWAFPFEILGLHPVLSVVVLFERMDGCLGLLLEAGVWTPKYKAIVPRSPHKWKLWTMQWVLYHEHNCVEWILACKHCWVKSINRTIRILLWLIFGVVRCPRW